MELFLIHFLMGELNSMDEVVDKEEIHAAQLLLSLGVEKTKVLSTTLDFDDHIFLDIISAIPSYLVPYITPGGGVTVDEAIWANYSPKLEKDHLLRNIKDKPHQRGILSYLCCQRFHFSDRPFAIAFAPTVTATAPTPQQAVTQMIHSLTPANYLLPEGWILVADSLWANPLNLQAFSALKWRIALSAKSNCLTIPEALRDVGTSDLLIGCARTYTDKMYIVQFYHSVVGISSILTNAVELSNGTPLLRAPTISYALAVVIFCKATKEELLSFFDLPDTAAALTKAQMVLNLTQWNVLRPPDHQHDDTPLTYEILKSFDTQRVAAIFEQTKSKLKTRVKTKEQMLEYLCPEQETHQTPQRSARQQKKFDSVQTNARRAEVRGPHTLTHRVYDLFHTYHASIDDMDKDFYDHCHMRYLHGAKHAALSHIAYYVLATCYAISDEYTREHLHIQSKQNNHVVYSHTAPKMYRFTCDLVHEYVRRNPYPHG
jgi:hypothetical protein